jgi:murein DD-endopeptidase MepM/ murein hydrolase activator NlpD
MVVLAEATPIATPTGGESDQGGSASLAAATLDIDSPGPVSWVGSCGQAMQYWELLAAAARQAGANPEFLGALMAVEGSGQRSVSPAGALGVMQLMPDKFRPGDDPFNVTTNLTRAAEHIALLQSTYGSGERVAAAYFGAIDGAGNVTGASDGNVNGFEYVRRFQAALACVRSGLGVPGEAVADLISPIGFPITPAAISFGFLDDYGLATAAYIRGAHGVQQLGTLHLAWDLIIPGAPANGRGYPVMAPMAGRITRTSDPAGGPLGIWLENPGLNLRIRLMHMDSLAPEVTDGAQVHAGQWLGTLGGQGTENFPHLHLSLEHLSSGERLDPARFFFRTGTRPLTALLNGVPTGGLAASVGTLPGDRSIPLSLPGLNPTGAPAAWGSTVATTTNGPEGHGLLGYDLDLGWSFLIGSPAARGQREPAIFKNTVVWLDSRNVNPADDPMSDLADVYSYDIQTGRERRLTASPGRLSNLIAADGRIAWVNHGESEAAVEVLDPGADTLTTVVGSQGTPGDLAIFGPFVAWVDRSAAPAGASGNLKGFNLETGQPLQLRQAGASSPAFVGSRLYWQQQVGSGDERLLRGRDVLSDEEFVLTSAAAPRWGLRSAEGTLLWLERSADDQTALRAYGPSSDESFRLDLDNASPPLEAAIGPGTAVWRQENGELGVAYLLDWDLADGHVFAERIGERPWAGRQGYRITNDGGIPLWNEFRRLGGTAALGRPLGERVMLPDGFIYQVTERALLQWQPALGQAVLANTFELLQQQGQDSRLEGEFQVPRPIEDDGSAGNLEKAQTARLSWLTDPRLRAFYFANPDPTRFSSWSEHDSIQLYGLPMSRPVEHSDTVAQRFQRAVLQRSSIEEHGLHRGDDIAVFRSGELLRQLLTGISGPATALEQQ